MAKALDPAEKVARAAASILDSIGSLTIENVRAKPKGVGGGHFIANGKLVALADAVDAWRASKL